MLVIEKMAMITRYGAYARSTSDRSSAAGRRAPAGIPTTPPPVAVAVPPPPEVTADPGPVDLGAADPDTVDPGAPPADAPSSASARSAVSTSVGCQTRTRRTRAPAESSEFFMDAATTER